MFKVGLGMMIVIILAGAIIGGLVWPYVGNTWTGYFGIEPKMNFAHGAVIGGLLVFTSIPGAVFTIGALVTTWISDVFIDFGQWAKTDEAEVPALDPNAPGIQHSTSS